MNLNPVPGVVIGLVEEVQPGQVTLSFPWLEQSYRTTWARVAMPLSGKERGVFYMPEQGDEVLVAFDRGDFDHPYVVGCVWNGVDTPPDDEVQNRVIQTPGQHTLRFEDKAGAKKVILKSAGQHSVEIDDAAGTLTVRTSGSLSLTLNDAAQSIVLSGGGRTITISGGAVQIT